MTRIILVRHGETSWTREARYQGHTNTPLTALGKKQAVCLARFFKKEKIDDFYSSDLGRAFETARLIAKPHGKPVRRDDRLKEMSFGLWEGQTFRELDRSGDPVYRRWCRGKTLTPNGGEPVSHFQKRVKAALWELPRKHPGKTVLVVTHGGVIRVALALALNLSRKHWWSFEVHTGSFTVLEFERGNVSVKCVNHLP